MKRQNLSSFVLPHDAYWAIYAPSGQQLWQQLQATDAGAHRAEFEIRKADLMPNGEADDTADSKAYDVWNGIAIISMVGPMTKAPTSMDDGCSTVYVRRQIRNAMRDDSITAILLRIDSPGGSVSGTQDLANDVALAVKTKPVYAYCEDYCCSAAYWVASQCEKVYAGPTAIVGSIGTYMVIQDMSGMAEQMGVKVHVLSTGPQKGAGVPGSEVTDEQINAFQQTVNDLNDHFLSGVATGRRMNRKAVEGVATGNVWIGSQAETNGLIDGIGSMDDVLQAMAAPKRGRPKNRANAEEGTDLVSIRNFPEADEHVTSILGIPPKTINFSSNDNSPLGATLEQTLEVALAAVDEGIDRATKIQTLRAPQGRTLGKENLSRLRVLHSNIGSLITVCESLPSTAPSPAAPVEAKTDRTDADKRADALLARRSFPSKTA